MAVSKFDYSTLSAHAHHSARSAQNLPPTNNLNGFRELDFTSQHDVGSGFEASIYLRDNEVVIAFAGTDDNPDMWADVQSFFAGVNGQLDDLVGWYQRAIQLARMISGMVAHFAGMKDAPLDHLPAKLKSIAAHMQTGYDMKRHAQEEGSHLNVVPDDFVDWFSICGPPSKCRERLKQLIDIGLDHVYQLGGSPVAHPHGARQAAMVDQAKLYATEVIPHFR